jgi:cell cycle checkpoint protein
MRKALQNIFASHFSTALSSSSSQRKSSDNPVFKEVLGDIIESSGGDIRNAIMSLQFACTINKSLSASSNGRFKNNKRETDSRSILKTINHREHHLQLFHLLGKLLYNKRMSCNKKYNGISSRLSES